MCSGFTSPPGEILNNTWQVRLVNLWTILDKSPPGEPLILEIKSTYVSQVRQVNLWKSNQLLTCRPIWEESKDWTMDCAFHSELHYFGISSFSSSFLMFSIITWIWLCGVMYIWTSWCISASKSLINDIRNRKSSEVNSGHDCMKKSECLQFFLCDKAQVWFRISFGDFLFLLSKF